VNSLPPGEVGDDAVLGHGDRAGAACWSLGRRMGALVCVSLRGDARSAWAIATLVRALSGDGSCRRMLLVGIW